VKTRILFALADADKDLIGELTSLSEPFLP
jgi:hypothetical protein